MTSPVDTYSRKGFLLTLGFAAVVVTVSSLVAFLTASEVVTCSRVSGVRVDCTLARTLAGRVPVRTATLQDVAEVAMVEYKERTGIGQPRRNNSEPSYRLRFAAPNGELLSVQTSFAELDSLRGSVEKMLGSRSIPQVNAVLQGSPYHPWIVGLLVCGLALMPLWVLGYFFPALRPNQRRRAA